MSDAPPEQASLGRAVKALRTERSLTQEQLANESGLHQHWISDIERGVRNPSYLSLWRLAAALDIAPSELMARVEAGLDSKPKTS
ncbi:MAG: helix-turn-helix transcriptional regulator [Solirubrobacteraceae bacterium]